MVVGGERGYIPGFVKHLTRGGSQGKETVKLLRICNFHVFYWQAKQESQFKSEHHCWKPIIAKQKDQLIVVSQRAGSENERIGRDVGRTVTQVCRLCIGRTTLGAGQHLE